MFSFLKGRLGTLKETLNDDIDVSFSFLKGRLGTLNKSNEKSERNSFHSLKVG
ncbi:hypothetical protein [Mesoaciditoga lauensis]|uniref:hypothetical protein n=1 Tax=Mesoaciditoga lauensis TaxID=1495039 RepID=UPI003CCC3046